VRLISGPVNLPTPAGVERIDVESASEMHEAARQSITDSDIFIGCAAVADYRAERFSEHKLKKTPGEETLMLRLVKNPDIVAAVAAAEPRPFVVGFAAETRDVEAYARDKLLRKNLDMIVANDVSQAGLGFGADKNAALLLWRSAASGTGRLELPAQSKATLADTIIAVVVERFHAKQHETLQTPQQDTP
ncbi:phosphopantothenoylcysteine decarboxylase, partial [Halomonas sp. BBD48]|nr:phosphopantothenoylcysteine decarboxylase [Halomonas sp. BBD48]